MGLPIISVDSKKRELIGNFRNSGAKWDRSFTGSGERSRLLLGRPGVGISYGIYDPPNNRGTVCVGISHDTLPDDIGTLIRTAYWKPSHRRKAASLFLLFHGPDLDCSITRFELLCSVS